MARRSNNCIIYNDQVFKYSSHGYRKPFGEGSFEFAGTSVVFQKTNGQPFSVTYTIDAVAKNLTK